jgi:N-acetylglucosaminyldiphosphoundecaprenol N-acetyl-beta-D-mannosaminyltransferase
VDIHDVTYEETLSHIARWIQEGGAHQIATVNVEFIMAAQTDGAFQQVLEQAALCVPDSVGVLWAARRQGRPLRQQVAGADLVQHIAERAAAAGWRVYFLGAAPGVAEQAAAVLAARYPGLTVAGCHAGSPAREEEAAIAGMVRAARADVLFVAYGHPRQDLWIARNQAATGAPVALGIGGAFDYIAGVVPRAPRAMRRLGLEWLFRLLRQPWRWRRQLVLPRFLWRVLADRGGG